MLGRMEIGVLGATGPAGRGLAVRLAAAGHDVLAGSRDRSRAEAIVGELRERWGENELFTALYASPNAEYEDLYPVSSELLDNVMNSDMTGTKLRAHDWYTEGMRL